MAPQRIGWSGWVTVILICADVLTRILAQQYTQPVFFDSLVTLAVGYWFGKH
jgi:hypothetical protein